MTRAASAGAIALIAALAATGTVSVAGAQSGGGEKPQASEVGVTPKEIRIAVVADVETSVAPGLFQGAVDGVRGFAKYMNKHGGLAGRKVVVDFIDSKLSADEARNAIITACQEDFAMVGTAALFVNNVDDMASCVDKAGAATGLPDIPFVTTEVAHQCNPTTFPMAPPQLICATKDQHPQTYQGTAARGLYYKKKFGKGLHGAYVFGSDLKAARNSSFSSGLGQIRTICCKSDEDFDLSARSPQSAFTPVVQALKDKNGSYAQVTGSYNMTVALRKEAKLQGLSSVKVWDCGTQCYDREFLEQGGADVDGQYVDALYAPFLDPAERKANKIAADYVKFTGEQEAGGLGGAYAFSAGLALRDAVNSVVEQDGVNGVTRKAVLEQLNSIHEFGADGLLAPIDLAGRKVSNCHVLLQVKDGDFQRIQPKKPGTFHCTKKGTYEVKLDLLT
jgi:ABC-type branched-subunit amino acid transport system substrate-binding protein